MKIYTAFKSKLFSMLKWLWQTYNDMWCSPKFWLHLLAIYVFVSYASNVYMMKHDLGNFDSNPYSTSCPVCSRLEKVTPIIHDGYEIKSRNSIRCPHGYCLGPSACGRVMAIAFSPVTFPVNLIDATSRVDIKYSDQELFFNKNDSPLNEYHGGYVPMYEE